MERHFLPAQRGDGRDARAPTGHVRASGRTLGRDSSRPGGGGGREAAEGEALFEKKC